ncbi:XRE family transcriptional regulator [Lacticaseibacillus paracasei]|uniref:XRE family transcriptional regulator n=1 Tax=Lacticaseibacillus paracasei TaxID=1597 RepID=UPI002F26B824
MIEHQNKTNNEGQDWARERLRNYLDTHENLNQQRFAYVAGVNPKTIGHFLNDGDTYPALLRKIARAMTTSYEKLISPISEEEYRELQKVLGV